tara:strand:+ start:2361 stop:3716 length:1356 start_codon:yes stop_codon:yes gene_type:complete
MATPNFNGLFKGPDENDIYALQKQERDAKIRQAMADSSGAGGNFYANLQAKANEQLSQSLQGGARTLLQGTALAPPEDPRLAKARKRDSDKTEIVAILAKYTDPASDGAEQVTEKEMKIGFSELMSRGYVQEAKDFLAMAQSMQKLDIDALKASNKGSSLALRQSVHDLNEDRNVKSTTDIGDFEDKTGRKFKKIALVMKDSTTSTVTIPWDGDESIPPSGVLVGIDSKGQTSKNRVTEAGETSEVTELQKRGTAKFKEDLTRKTNELASDLRIDEDKAKRMAEATMVTRATAIDNGTTARRGKPALKALLELAKVRNKGGDASAALASFKRVFGMENKSDAEFRTGAQLIMVKNLKRLFGPRATDKDMEELKKAFMGEGQTQEANLAIINRFLSDYQFEIDQADYFYDNPDSDGGAYYNHLRSRQQALEDSVETGVITINGGQYTVERVQ